MLGLFVCLLIIEIKTSRIQSEIFSRITKKFSYTVQDGPGTDIRFPKSGPYDIRLGYTRIPGWVGTLRKKGFVIERQARWSHSLLSSVDMGLYVTYHEKSQSGICIRDEQDRKMLCQLFPQRIYPDYASIPPILIQMLVFIENRHLLNEKAPHQNPAIEWKRLLKALFDSVAVQFDEGRNIAGGSTLPTQLEKFRHSQGGITDMPLEKLKQILSSSLRTYSYGKHTLSARRQILLDYINGIPLAATTGFGEVMGIGDGLWAWYGMDFNTVNQTLRDAEKNYVTPEQAEKIGMALKAVLSLFIAQRRPSAYLITHREDLEELTNSYCRLLAARGIISTQIRDSAIAASLNFKENVTLVYPADISQQKTASLIRSNLMTLLGIDGFYDLDRLDLDVKSSLDSDLQKNITNMFYLLNDPGNAAKFGLKGPHLLDKGDPSKIIYSFTLFERSSLGNILRVQTNNFDGPFNIDEQMKLDLGSTSKLRVLIHYLDITAKLYDQQCNLPTEELKRISSDLTRDDLTRWLAAFLSTHRDVTLTTLLDAAMNRTYSAGNKERFFTGGGLHTFTNFDKEDNQREVSVKEAFRRSVNLVFIRMLRDIVNYYVYQRYNVTPQYVEKLSQADKNRLLSVFADREGIQFIKRFYQKYRGKSTHQATDLLFMGMPDAPYRLAAVFRYLNPKASSDELFKFLEKYLPESRLTQQHANRLHRQYGPQRYSLADIGYIGHIHPLELWLVKFIQDNPQATLPQIIQNSTDQRQTVYQWLFNTKSRRKQNIRIRTIIELEAFQDILIEWKRLGYPFDYLVPSYASAIGSSGDRTAALAELMGIVLNNGIYYPRSRIQRLHFAKHTPYETLMNLTPPAGAQIISPEIARVVKQALIDVVHQGTAVRLKDAVFGINGNPLIIGGKTGTGDHRYKTYDDDANLISSKVLNRSAVFVFFLGDYHFGAISAYVSGEDAADYEFSSSLPVAVLKRLLPDIIPSISCAPAG